MSIFTSDKTSAESGHINVIAEIKAKHGNETEVRAIFEALVTPSRAEDGCKAYHLLVDKKDPTRLFTYEEWTSEEKLDLHLAGAKPILTRVQPLLDAELKITVLEHLI